MRRLLILLPLTLLGIPVLAIALVLGLVQTGPGKRQLARMIENLTTSPDFSIRIGAIEGFIPVDMTVTDLAIADRDGIWLQVDRVRLDWSPLDLLGRVLHVEAVEAGSIRIERAPVASAASEPSEEPSGDLLPRLPVAVELDRLAIDEVALGEALLGQAVALRVDGKARLGDPSDGLEARLAVARTDGAADGANLDLRFVPETEELSVDLEVDGPAGGLIARLADLPGLPPVRIALAGGGVLDDWRGRLDATAGDLVRAGADARIVAAPAGRRLEIEAEADIARLLPGDLQPLVGNAVRLTASLALPETGPIGVETLRLEAPAAVLAVDGTFDPGDETVALSYRLEAGSPDAVSGLMPGAGWRSLAVDGRITGRLAHPDMDAAVDGRFVALPGAAFDRLRGTARVRPSGPFADAGTRIGLATSGSIEGLTLGADGVDTLVGSSVEWAVDGAFSPSGDVSVERLEVTLPSGRLTAEGELSDWGLATPGFRARAELPDLSELQGLLGRPVSGRAFLDFDARSQGRTVTATLKGELEDPVTGIPQVDGLLGARTRIDGRGSFDPAGTVDLSGLVIDAERMRAEVAGIVADGGIAFDWSLSLPDLASADPALAGTVAASGNVSGPLDQPTAEASLTATDVVAAGRSVPEARLDLTVRNLLAAPAGSVRIEATVEGMPARAEADFDRAPDGTTAVDGLSVAFGSLDLAGSLRLEPTGLVSGTIAGGVGNLADFSGLAGQPLAGSADLDIALSATDGRQRVEAGLEARRIALGQAVRIGTAELRATVDDALARPVIAADLAAGRVAGGGQSLDTVSLRAAGPLDALGVSLRAEGAQLGLAAEATIGRRDQDLRVVLVSFEGRYRRERVSLTQAAALTFGGAGLAVDGLELALRRGLIALSGRYGETADLRLQVTRLPLGLAALAAPELGLGGVLDGEARLSGSRSAPQARFSFAARGVRMAETEAAGIDPLDVMLDGSWRNGRLEARTGLTIPRGGELAVTAALALPAGPGGVPELRPDAAVEATLDGQFDLALANPLLAGGADEVGGTVDIGLRLGGTIEKPVGMGDVRLTEGTYRNSVNGTDISGIEAVLTAEGDVIRLVSLDGFTPNGGTLSGQGTIRIDPAAGLPADFRLQLRQADLVDSALVAARASADLAIAGALLQQPLLSGTVTVEQAEIRIPSTMPPSAPTIPVTELNAPPAVEARLREAAAAEAAAAEGGGFVASLDVRVTANQQLYVRGRGLDAEMGGDLAIRGTSAAPDIDGGFSLRQGTFDLLGNLYEFERGNVTLAGGSRIDPVLDFLAAGRAGDILARIEIAGTASAPRISFSSDPDLPQDEILARILFGKATGQLNAFEAVQLAQSVATLTGMSNGGGLLGDVRTAVGLDRLSVEAGAGGETSLSAGKYIADGVFVGVRQGLTGSQSTGSGGGSRATVEIEVTPHITIESDIGGDSSSRVGVRMEWDY